MLLRRLMQHVKDQNWFAVGLDFLIVVTGVFIGIQVANWNAARLQVQREAMLLEALRTDFRSIDQSLLHSVAYHERSIEGLRAIATALRAGTLSDDERLKFENGLRYGYLDAASSTASGVLLELLASGDLTLLQDPHLRAALSDFESHREASISASSDIRRYVSQYLRSFTAQFDYDVNQAHPTPGADPSRVRPISAIGHYDLNAMIEDRQFQESVDELHELQTLWLNWTNRTLDRVVDIRRLLEDGPIDQVELP
jgi:hypothetical protein